MLGRIGTERVAEAGHVFKHVVLTQHLEFACVEYGCRLFEPLLGDGGVDEGNGLLGLSDVDAKERFLREIVGEVGAAVVEGEGLGQVTVGDLLGPVVGLRGVLDDDMIAVGAQHVPLVVEAAETAAEHVELVAIVGLELLDETDAVEMALGEGLVAGDDGDELGLLADIGGLDETVVVEGVAAVAVGILGIAHKPGQDGRAEVDVGVARLRLTGTYHTELTEIGVGIDQHGARLGGEHDGVLGSHLTGLRLTDTLALNHPEVGILTTVVEDKLVTAVERTETVALGLAAHDCA